MHKDKELQLEFSLSTMKVVKARESIPHDKHSQGSNIVDLSARIKDAHNEAIIASLSRQGLLRKKTE